MQTFLPYSDFVQTFECLDYKRLGKQRLEARQIWSFISGEFEKKNGRRSRWECHPAVKMWIGYEKALARYYNHCLKEWIKRGYNNTMQPIPSRGKVKMPEWMGRNSFHSAHRQTLLFKLPSWYSQFGWSEKPKYEYEWPV